MFDVRWPGRDSRTAADVLRQFFAGEGLRKVPWSGQIPKSHAQFAAEPGASSRKGKLKVEILPGIEDGQLIKINDMGEAGERGAAAGDLYIRDPCAASFDVRTPRAGSSRTSGIEDCRSFAREEIGSANGLRRKDFR